jgi:hypothetical protein
MVGHVGDVLGNQLLVHRSGEYGEMARRPPEFSVDGGGFVVTMRVLILKLERKD